MPDDSLRVEYTPLGAEDSTVTGPTPPQDPRKAGGLRRFLARLLTWVGLALVAATLPFALLIRVSVETYHAYGVGSWLSLAAGAGATVLLLCLYVALLRWRLGGRPRFSRWTLRGVGVVVAGYCGYALIYLSAASAKSADVRATYRSLDPLLRVATSTVLLVDRDAVVTDLARTAADYAAWGLPVNESSLHLVQDDGFVHAADFRTRGRPEWRNAAMEAYFRLMGFRTLRHVGTADHLHVSLPPPG